MINIYDDSLPTEEVRDLPSFLWVLRHTTRLKYDDGYLLGHAKPIFDMDLVRGVFSHAQVTCVNMSGEDDVFSFLFTIFRNFVYSLIRLFSLLFLSFFLVIGNHYQ